MPFKLIQKLDEEYEKLDYEDLTKDAPMARGKCDATMASFRRLREAIKELAPAVEQTKGLAKGLELSIPVVTQFKHIVRGSIDKEELGKEEGVAQIQLLTRVETALADSSRQKREELIRAAGKIDGIYDAAVKCLEQVAEYIVGIRRQNRFMEDNPHLFAKEPPAVESIPPMPVEVIPIKPRAAAKDKSKAAAKAKPKASAKVKPAGDAPSKD